MFFVLFKNWIPEKDCVKTLVFRIFLKHNKHYSFSLRVLHLNTLKW